MAEKVYVIEDPDETRRSRKTPRENVSLTPDRSPAAAYSLSLLIWGAGQYHADLIVKGLSFLFFMLLVAAGSAFVLLRPSKFLSLLQSRSIALSDAFLVAEFVLLALLVFWVYNASDAYHVVARERKRRFTGVKSRFFPFLCSLLFPGWGQYLNGQPRKGSIFAALWVVCLFAALSGTLTYVAWMLLDPSNSRDIIEGIFAAALFILPFLPIVWLIACYDALKVSGDEYFKEPFLERLKALNNRRRTQGWMRGVFPRIGNIFVLFLVLALVVAVVYWVAPENYYLSLMEQVRRHLQQKGMTIVPEIIGALLSHLPR